MYDFTFLYLYLGTVCLCCDGIWLGLGLSGGSSILSLAELSIPKPVLPGSERTSSRLILQEYNLLFLSQQVPSLDCPPNKLLL